MFVAVVACALAALGTGAGAVTSLDNDLTPKLRFYYSALDHYTELPLDSADRILATTWYNASRTTLIFVHGFTGKPTGLAIATIVETYLRRGDCNVALLNWEGLAAAVAPTLADSYLNWAAPNARKLGVRFAATLVDLSAAGLDLERTQLVGHSLGAHVLGLAGNALLQQNILLPWITALDPASVAFEGKPLAGRLHARSAAVVLALHSDPSKYGCRRPMGSVDFWPNYRPGNVRQPGCPEKMGQKFSPEDLCSHNRSWQLLAEAVARPGSILGSRARNFREWKNYLQAQRNATTMDLDAYGKTVLTYSSVALPRFLATGGMKELTVPPPARFVPPRGAVAMSPVDHGSVTNEYIGI